jgi:predicted lipoprotein with Yx(FWY)xxD motif
MKNNRTFARLAVPVLMLGVGSMALAAAAPAAKVQPPAVRVATISVNGKKTRVLESSKGYTLYYFTKSTAKKNACTGSCASIWPAYKAAAIPKIKGLAGKFSLLRGQLEYQGHLLYLYTGDKGPGESHGEGFLHEWYVATPSLGLKATVRAKGPAKKTTTKKSAPKKSTTGSGSSGSSGGGW